MNGWAISVVAFWGAMAGVGLMLVGQLLMWFAPVQSLTFRRRFKLSLAGALILSASVTAMIGGIVLVMQQASLS